MRNTISERTRAVMGLVGIALLLGIAVVVVNYGNGYFDSGYELTAQFSSASQGLYPDSDVKVRGVNVGTVDSIELDPQGNALVRMNIQDGVDIAQTAVASIEPLSIFGPKFVNLRLGDGELTGSFFAAGDTITNTEEAIEFTLVLGDASDLLEHVRPGDLTTVVHTLAEGVGGLGEELGETVDSVDTLVDVAERNLPQARQFLADVALVAQNLAAHSSSIVTTATRLHEVLPEINRRPDQVAALLDDVSRLSTTLSAILRTNADVVGPTVEGLAQLADLLERRQSDVVVLVDTLNIFFGTLAAVLRIPNEPTSPVAGALIGGLPSDLCEIFPVVPCTGGLPAGASAAASGPNEVVAASATPTDPTMILADLVLHTLPTTDASVLQAIYRGRS